MSRRQTPKARPCLVVSVSGTGGHVFPLLAIVYELRNQMEIHAIVETGDLSNRERFQDLGCQVYEVNAGKLRRYHGKGAWYFFHPTNIRENVRDGFRLISGIYQSLVLLRRLRPQAVFVKGGYVGVPVGVAAGLLGLPLVTHDSDTVPSLTSRVLARWTSRIAVGFPREYYDYPSRKLVHTGIPVRKEFLRSTTAHRAARKKPLIAVVGGSQGSHRLNLIVFSCLKQLIDIGRVVHITGMHDIKTAQRLQTTLGKQHYAAFDFVTRQYPSLIASADIVICRAGATTVAECALSHTPMIIVPNAFLTEGHQLRNAQALSDASAATILEEEVLAKNPVLLANTLRAHLTNKKKLDWHRRNAAAFFPPDATQRIAKLLVRTAHGPSSS